jgi:hypothetical protein
MNPQDLKQSRDYLERSKLTFHTTRYARGITPSRQRGDWMKIGTQIAARVRLSR